MCVHVMNTVCVVLSPPCSFMFVVVVDICHAKTSCSLISRCTPPRLLSTISDGPFPRLHHFYEVS